MTEEKYSVFVPIDVLEKAKDANGNEVLRIGGIASNMNTGADVDGEILDVNGFDLQRFLSKGFINYQHLAGKDPASIIGEPTKAEVRDGKLYIEAILYPKSEMARKVYDLAKALENSPGGRRLGYSIEGKALQRDPLNKKYIRKSMITGCAVTPMPKCSGTELTLIKGGFDTIDYDTLEKAEGADDFLIDTVDEDGTRWTVDKWLNIEKAEGSRGGHVIGHTKSGKPIYDTAKHPEHSGFTKQDHQDAIDIHKHQISSTENKIVGQEKKKEWKRGSDSKTVFSHDHHKGQIAAHAQARFSAPADSIEKSMMAGGITGTDTHNQSLTMEPLKEESIDGVKKKKKKNKENFFDSKEKFSKGEIYKELFSRFNLGVDLAKSFCALIEKVQYTLTPDMEKPEFTPEAIRKAMELLDIVKAEGSEAVTAAATTTEAATTQDDLSKAVDADKLKAEYAEIMKKAEELKKQAAEVNIDLSNPQGNPQGGEVSVLKKAEELEATPSVNLDEIQKGISANFDPKFKALGILLTKRDNEINDLKKSLDEQSEFNARLAERLGMIEKQPNERKSLTGVKYTERFEKAENGGAATEEKTFSLGNMAHRTALADMISEKAFSKGEDSKVLDQVLAETVSYIQTTGNLWGNESGSQAVAARLAKEFGVKVVR